MIDVEHDALRTFKKDTFAAAPRLIQFRQTVAA